MEANLARMLIEDIGQVAGRNKTSKALYDNRYNVAQSVNPVNPPTVK